jgi:hypothetical protein
MFDLAQRLGLELISAKPADFGFCVNGRLARARTPERSRRG